MTLDIDEIEARANATLEEPCNEQHGVFAECLSCKSDVLQSLRTDIPALIARVRELEAQIAAVVAIHRVDTVYDECEHDHAEEDAANGVVYAGEAGLTCAKVHDVCRNCCVNALGGQSDICSDEHQHGPNEPPCRTIAALRALGWKEQEK